MPTTRHSHRPKRPPIESLNALRFVAAMLVIVYHYFWLGTLQDAEPLSADPRGPLSMALARWLPMLSDAHLAVDFFAILSGFVLAYAHWDAVGEGRFHFGEFLKRRFARVYPLHVAMLLVCLAMATVARLLDLQFSQTGFAYSGILPNLLLLHSFGVTPGLTFNGPSWFVSAAFFTYLLFPMLVITFSRSRMPSIVNVIAAVTAFLGVYFLLPGDKILTHRAFDFGVLRVAVEFPIGIALFRLLRDYESSGDTWIRPWHVAALGVTIAVLMQLQVEEAAIVVMLAAFIFACAAAEMRHGLRWLTRPWLLYGGEISYAMYMIHMPLYVCLLKACGVAGLVSRGSIASDLAALGGAVLVVPFSMVVERLFERPAYHFTMGVLTRSPEPASSSA